MNWQPAARHDVVLVAGHYLQHLVSREVRSVLGPKAEAHVAEQLRVNVKTARRLLTGEQFMKITELVELAFLVGPTVLRTVPQDLLGLFPTEYHPMLAGWDRERGTLPSFTAPDLSGKSLWQELVERLMLWLSGEIMAGRATFIGSSVMAYILVGYLTELGVSTTLVLPDPGAVPPDWSGLRIVAATTVLLWVTYLPDGRTDPQAQLGTMLNGLHKLNARDSTGIATIIIGDHLRAQAMLHIPQLLSSATDEDFIIPFETIGRLGLSSTDDVDTRDVTGRILTRIDHDQALIMAVAVVKT